MGFMVGLCFFSVETQDKDILCRRNGDGQSHLSAHVLQWRKLVAWRVHLNLMVLMLQNKTKKWPFWYKHLSLEPLSFTVGGKGRKLHVAASLSSRDCNYDLYFWFIVEHWCWVTAWRMLLEVQSVSNFVAELQLVFSICVGCVGRMPRLSEMLVTLLSASSSEHKESE